MSVSAIAGQPLQFVKRISPSKYHAMMQCPLREIWASNRLKPVLPVSPAARLGTVVHEFLKDAHQGKIENEHAMLECWNDEIRHVEAQMLSCDAERHLAPLKSTAYNFEVKKILAFRIARTLFTRGILSLISETKQIAESWIETPDGKAGGRVDLIRSGPEGKEIIDFKTGQLTDGPESTVPKEEYVQQVKMYAAIYFTCYNEWPSKLTLLGLNQRAFNIEFEPSECKGVLKDAIMYLDTVNENIGAGMKPEYFARPSPGVCKYCLYRPVCKKYWEARLNGEGWPYDIQGTIKEKQLLANGKYRLVLDANGRDLAIRGLTQSRHTFITSETENVVICNLGRDTQEGCFIERPLTAGYGIQ